MDMNGCCLCVALWLCSAWSVSGFHCYQCSFDWYNKADWNKEECITNPETIRPTFPCNETSYCISQEKININTGIVLFFYRSCSLTPMDYCTTNGPEMLNAVSCQGELCNNHIDLCNTASSLKFSEIEFIIGLIYCIIYFSTFLCTYPIELL
ncbi:hypothetical protein DPMN_105786 [Dreissena polymorpha]|uniref:Uncharacterized protein n=1 Tax=Dreissena polymorpha TaxID=45954 RepID=A0A9D4K3V4_DREPO|nr:hypothetical protein DPMN_105786 [Dreissena polymorpha]